MLDGQGYLFLTARNPLAQFIPRFKVRDIFCRNFHIVAGFRIPALTREAIIQTKATKSVNLDPSAA